MAQFVFSGNGLLAVVCSSTFRILDCRDGSCKFSCTISKLEPNANAAKTISGNPKQDLALGHDIASSFSPSGQLFGLCSGHKILMLWNTETWECISKRKIEKRATAISFTHQEEYIIVSDKAGDVYRYSTNETETKGSLLLGHISMIMDMVVTEDDKFIITADRDEKIRVSHYPNSYNIEAYCLGHTDFVSRLCVLSSNGLEILVSGSGDGHVKFWDYQKGILLHTEKMEGNLQQSKEKGDEEREDGNESQVVFCMACCRKTNVVCVVTERCQTLQLYHVTQESVFKLHSIEASSPPWYVTFAPDGRIWCIQPKPDEPVIIFQAKETGPNTKFCRLKSTDDIPVYNAASDWSYLEECVDKEPHLSLLRKKEIDNMTDYLTRKEERIKHKKERLAAMRSPAKKIKLQT